MRLLSQPEEMRMEFIFDTIFMFMLHTFQNFSTALEQVILKINAIACIYPK